MSIGIMARASRAVAVAIVAMVALVAIPASAAAKPKQVAGIDTTLKLKAGVAAALEEAGISVAPIHPASAGKDGIAFPITGGKFDPKKIQGKLEHSGGLSFTRHSAELELTDFVVDVDKSPTLVASVGDAKVPILDLDASKAEVKSGVITELSNVKAALTKAAADALNDTLEVDAFAKGLVIGETKSRILPETVELKKGATTLALDPGAAAALAGEGISVAPIDPASAGDDGISFPITGGSINNSDATAQIKHSGGLLFSEGATELGLKKFVIDAEGPSAVLTAKVGNGRVPILNLDLAGSETDIDGKKVTISGVDATLTGEAAGALNATFATHAFTEGLLIGSATVAAKAK